MVNTTNGAREMAIPDTIHPLGTNFTYMGAINQGTITKWWYETVSAQNNGQLAAVRLAVERDSTWKYIGLVQTSFDRESWAIDNQNSWAT